MSSPLDEYRRGKRFVKDVVREMLRNKDGQLVRTMTKHERHRAILEGKIERVSHNLAVAREREEEKVVENAEYKKTVTTLNRALAHVSSTARDPALTRDLAAELMQRTTVNVKVDCNLAEVSQLRDQLVQTQNELESVRVKENIALSDATVLRHALEMLLCRAENVTEQRGKEAVEALVTDAKQDLKKIQELDGDPHLLKLAEERQRQLAEMSAVKKEIEKLQSDKKTLETALRKAEHEVVQMRLKMMERDSSMAVVSKKIRSVEAKLEEETSSSGSRIEAAERLAGEITQKYEAELRKFRELVEEKTKRLNEQTKLVDYYKAQVSEAKFEAIRTKKEMEKTMADTEAALKAEMSAAGELAKGEIEKLRSERTAFESKLGITQNELFAANGEISSLEQRLEGRDEELAAVKLRAESLAEELEHTKTVFANDAKDQSTAANRLERMVARVRELEEAARRKDEECWRTQEERDGLRSDLDGAMQRVRQMEAAVAASVAASAAAAAATVSPGGGGGGNVGGGLAPVPSMRRSRGGRTPLVASLATKATPDAAAFTLSGGGGTDLLSATSPRPQQLDNTVGSPLLGKNAVSPLPAAALVPPTQLGTNSALASPLPGAVTIPVPSAVRSPAIVFSVTSDEQSSPGVATSSHSPSSLAPPGAAGGAAAVGTRSVPSFTLEGRGDGTTGGPLLPLPTPRSTEAAAAAVPDCSDAINEGRKAVAASAPSAAVLQSARAAVGSALQGVVQWRAAALRGAAGGGPGIPNEATLRADGLVADLALLLVGCANKSAAPAAVPSRRQPTDSGSSKGSSGRSIRRPKPIAEANPQQQTPPEKSDDGPSSAGGTVDEPAAEDNSEVTTPIDVSLLAEKLLAGKTVGEEEEEEEGGATPPSKAPSRGGSQPSLKKVDLALPAKAAVKTAAPIDDGGGGTADLAALMRPARDSGKKRGPAGAPAAAARGGVTAKLADSATQTDEAEVEEDGAGEDLASPTDDQQGAPWGSIGGSSSAVVSPAVPFTATSQSNGSSVGASSAAAVAAAAAGTGNREKEKAAAQLRGSTSSNRLPAAAGGGKGKVATGGGKAAASLPSRPTRQTAVVSAAAASSQTDAVLIMSLGAATATVVGGDVAALLAAAEKKKADQRDKAIQASLEGPALSSVTAAGATAAAARQAATGASGPAAAAASMLGGGPSTRLRASSGGVTAPPAVVPTATVATQTHVTQALSTALLPPLLSGEAAAQQGGGGMRQFPPPSAVAGDALPHASVMEPAQQEDFLPHLGSLAGSWSSPLTGREAPAAKVTFLDTSSITAERPGARGGAVAAAPSAAAAAVPPPPVVPAATAGGGRSSATLERLVRVQSNNNNGDNKSNNNSNNGDGGGAAAAAGGGGDGGGEAPTAVQSGRSAATGTAEEVSLRGEIERMRRNQSLAGLPVKARDPTFVSTGGGGGLLNPSSARAGPTATGASQEELRLLVVVSEVEAKERRAVATGCEQIMWELYAAFRSATLELRNKQSSALFLKGVRRSDHNDDHVNAFIDGVVLYEQERARVHERQLVSLRTALAAMGKFGATAGPAFMDQIQALTAQVGSLIAAKGGAIAAVDDAAVTTVPVEAYNGAVKEYNDLVHQMESQAVIFQIHEAMHETTLRQLKAAQGELEGLRGEREAQAAEGTGQQPLGGGFGGGATPPAGALLLTTRGGGGSRGGSKPQTPQAAGGGQQQAGAAAHNLSMLFQTIGAFVLEAQKMVTTTAATTAAAAAVMRPGEELVSLPQVQRKLEALLKGLECSATPTGHHRAAGKSDRRREGQDKKKEKGKEKKKADEGGEGNRDKGGEKDKETGRQQENGVPLQSQVQQRVVLGGSSSAPTAEPAAGADTEEGRHHHNHHHHHKTGQQSDAARLQQLPIAAETTASSGKAATPPPKSTAAGGQAESVAANVESSFSPSSAGSPSMASPACGDGQHDAAASAAVSADGAGFRHVEDDEAASSGSSGGDASDDDRRQARGDGRRFRRRSSLASLAPSSTGSFSTSFASTLPRAATKNTEIDAQADLFDVEGLEKAAGALAEAEHTNEDLSERLAGLLEVLSHHEQLASAVAAVEASKSRAPTVHLNPSNEWQVAAAEGALAPLVERVQHRLAQLHLRDILDEELRTGVGLAIDGSVEDAARGSDVLGVLKETRARALKALISHIGGRYVDASQEQATLASLFRSFPKAFVEHAAKGVTPELTFELVHQLSTWWNQWVVKTESLHRSIFENKQDSLRRIMQLCEMLEGVSHTVNAEYGHFREGATGAAVGDVAPYLEQQARRRRERLLAQLAPPSPPGDGGGAVSPGCRPAGGRDLFTLAPSSCGTSNGSLADPEVALRVNQRLRALRGVPKEPPPLQQQRQLLTAQESRAVVLQLARLPAANGPVAVPTVALMGRPTPNVVFPNSGGGGGGRAGGGGRGGGVSLDPPLAAYWNTRSVTPGGLGLHSPAAGRHPSRGIGAVGSGGTPQPALLPPVKGKR